MPVDPSAFKASLRYSAASTSSPALYSIVPVRGLRGILGWSNLSHGFDFVSLVPPPPWPHALAPMPALPAEGGPACERGGSFDCVAALRRLEVRGVRWHARRSGALPSLT